MPVEVCSYRLTVRGQPVGTHTLRTERRGRSVALEGRLQLQGSLGTATVTQRSRSHAQRHFSFSYEEQTQRRGDNRSYRIDFDHEQGLVRASRGSNDRAELPYLRPFRDPLSLLHQLRQLGDGEDPVRVPMLGKDVLVHAIGAIELETALGRKTARAFTLQPGGCYVYVDREAPHHILAMTQRVEGQLLDAQLVQIGQEAAMPDGGGEGGGGDGGKAKKRRRRRRRSRRRGRRRKNDEGG